MMTGTDNTGTNLTKANKAWSIESSRKQQILAAFPNTEKLIIGFNPVASMRRYEKETVSVEAAQKPNILTLREIAVIYTPNTPSLLLEAWLYNLNDFVNVQNKLNSEQIPEIAYLINNRYSDLNMAELTLLFKRIKMGHYGPLYGNLSGDNILRWFLEFSKEKDWVLAKQKERHSLQNSMTCRQRSEGILSGLVSRFPGLLTEIRKAPFGGPTTSIGQIASKIKNKENG